MRSAITWSGGNVVHREVHMLTCLRHNTFPPWRQITGKATFEVFIFSFLERVWIKQVPWRLLSALHRIRSVARYAACLSRRVCLDSPAYLRRYLPVSVGLVQTRACVMQGVQMQHQPTVVANADKGNWGEQLAASKESAFVSFECFARACFVHADESGRH